MIHRLVALAPVILASISLLTSPPAHAEDVKLPPTSTGSAQTRPATSVTILMSGIPFSGTVSRTIALANGFLLWPQIA